MKHYIEGCLVSRNLKTVIRWVGGKEEEFDYSHININKILMNINIGQTFGCFIEVNNDQDTLSISDIFIINRKNEELENWLKHKCNRFHAGHCSALRCLLRGGYTKQIPVNTDIATCEPFEILKQLNK